MQLQVIDEADSDLHVLETLEPHRTDACDLHLT